jgi:hypothetical protein
VGGTLAVQIAAAVVSRLPFMPMYMYLSDAPGLADEVVFGLLEPPEGAVPGDYYVLAKVCPPVS